MANRTEFRRIKPSGRTAALMEPRRDGAACRFLRYAYTEITPRQQADDLPTGDYRQVSAAAFLGETKRFLRRAVSRDRLYVSGHHVAEYRSVRVLSSGEHSADSVSLGKNTYQHVPGVHYQHRGNIPAVHLLRRFPDCHLERQHQGIIDPGKFGRDWSGLHGLHGSRPASLPLPRRSAIARGIGNIEPFQCLNSHYVISQRV